jgi:hypothetical protein
MIIFNFLNLCLLIFILNQNLIISSVKQTCPKYVCDSSLTSNCVVHSWELIKSEESHYVQTNFKINDCENDFYCNFNFTNPGKNGICTNISNFENHKLSLKNNLEKKRPKFSL